MCRGRRGTYAAAGAAVAVGAAVPLDGPDAVGCAGRVQAAIARERTSESAVARGFEAGVAAGVMANRSFVRETRERWSG